jgi:hypothetical protein
MLSNPRLPNPEVVFSNIALPIQGSANPFPVRIIHDLELSALKAVHLHRLLAPFTPFDDKTAIGGQRRPGLAPFSKRLTRNPYRLRYS